MGHRLSRIYTRTGDDGTTGLSNGKRTDKDSPRVEAMGTIDELNCAIGLVLSEHLPGTVHDNLVRIQHRLFDLGAELSMPGRALIDDEDVRKIESLIDLFNAKLPALKEFILPGGGRSSATCHLARAVCRRAERRLIALRHDNNVNNLSVIYLNRLSDLLFVIARILSRDTGQAEVMWDHH
jgi:cob(I)alamin adenosyltransferase